MLKMIYTLPDYLEDKNIYVWNVKRNSMVVFAMLAFRGIRITGFVTANKKYVGETFFNRPVCYAGDIEKDKSAILVIANGCLREEISPKLHVFYCDELWRMNADLKRNPVVIYGAGGEAANLYACLRNNHILVKAFCVTDKKTDTYMNVPLISLDELSADKEYAVIISPKSEAYRREIQYSLEQKGIENIYIDEFMAEDDLAYGTFVQSIDKAIQEKRKIYIYTKEVDENAKLITKTLKLYQVEVEGYLYRDPCADDRIKDVWELAYLDSASVFVIVSETDRFQLQDACELLEEIGLSLGKFNYTGIRLASYEYKNRPLQVTDSLLGYSECGKKVGFHVYGKESSNDIKIVILGGSTSNDGIFRGTCWPRMLYQQMQDHGYSVSIYNGAHCGNKVIEELLRLLRDGYVLKPDFVISMSGVNDSGGSPVKNRFYLEHMRIREEQNLGREYFRGLEVQEQSFEFWMRMERVMKAVSEIYGAKFLCYLQPMKFGKTDMSLFEESVFTDEKRDVHSFREMSSQNEFYRNLIHIFDNEDDMFIDACHYTEKAKRVLADIVYRDLVEEIERK